MSSHEPPTDPAAAAAGAGGGPAAGPGEGQPSPEEVRAYLEQVRGAPVDQVVAEVASVLLNAAQVKLGRRDARLLLDVVGDLTDRIRGQLPDELTGQLADVLAQLRLAQVEAEREVAQAAAQGHAEPGDIGRGDDGATGADGSGDQGGSDAGSSGTQSGSEPGSSSGPSAASRLWIPGR